MKPGAVIIFTDLDGTLLDHHDYSFDAALPALNRVRELGIPLILTTSKTLAEVKAINRLLGNARPAIVENGCALCFPLGTNYPFDIGAYQQHDGYAVWRFPPSYEQIRDFIARQRARHGWRLRGFGDMDNTEVAGITGLSPDQGAAAKQRLCSEPFLWLDDEAHLAQFVAAAEAAGMRVTRGGRFWHLMGTVGKAEAIARMRELFAAGKHGRGTVIALGDSENDRGMLHDADIAVVIKRHDGTHLDCSGRSQTLHTQHAGPAGWNQAILDILQQLQQTERQR